MGLVYQASSPVSDSTKMTVSMWVRTPPGIDSYIMEWGAYPTDLTTFPTPGSSYIWVSNISDPNLGNRLQVQVAGAYRSIDPNDFFTGGDPGPGNSDFLADALGIGGDPTMLTPWCWAEANKIGTALDPGKWFHLMFACDLSSGVSFDNTTGNPFVICINGVPRPLDHFAPAIDHNNGMAVSDYGVLQSLTTSPSTGIDTSLIVAYNSDLNTATVKPPFDFFPFSYIQQDGNPDDGFVFWTDTMTVPPLSINFSGQPIGFPRIPATAVIGVEDDSANASPVFMGPTFVYVGQFIDPRDPDNFAKFVNVSLTGGTPQPVNVATAAFGRPDYLFSGGKAGFPFNQGTAGDVVTLGTILDTTGPSY